MSMQHIFSKPIYLDANATEILRPAAKNAAFHALEQIGNPASTHFYGRQARRILEDARHIIAAYFKRDADSCIFTSGGTEANILALHGFAHSQNRPIFIGATEHDAIRNSAPHAQIIKVHENGRLDLAHLKELLLSQKSRQEAPQNPPLICIMAANNETGILSPLEEIAALCEEFNALLHIDAVQAMGRVSLPLASLKKASFAISAHKMGGLKGAGALILPHDHPLPPLLPGGGQERGRRGGTPALPNIAAMSAALQESTQQNWQEIEAFRDALEEKLILAGAEIIGHKIPRLPNVICAILPSIASQIQLMTLDLEGFCVSAGSACSSGKVTESHILRAMGYQEKAGQAIRISLPWNIQKDALDAFAHAYQKMAKALLKQV